MPTRFQALDGWRGLAALMVALFHSPFYGALYANPLVRNSYLWVDFFFVLSGFVITHATSEGLRGRGAATGFLIRRFGRVWPLHAAVLGGFVVLELAKVASGLGGIAVKHPPFTGAHSFDSLIANLALVQSLGIYDISTWNIPSWSICVEFWTYVLFTVTLRLPPQRRVAIGIAICLGAGVCLAYLASHREFSEITYDYGLVRCLFGFFIGHLTYRLAAAKPFAGSAKAGLIAEAMAILAVIGFVCGAGVILPPALGSPIFAAAIYVFAAERGPVSRGLRSRPAASLGAWSYAIYMTHPLVMTVMVQTTHLVEKLAHVTLLRAAQSNDPNVLAVALPGFVWWDDGATLIYLAITLAISAWVYRSIEMPGRAAFAGYARSWAAEPAPTMAGAPALLRRG